MTSEAVKRPARPWVWGLGAALWAGVAVALFVMFRDRTNNEPQAVGDDKQPTQNKPAIKWDEKGVSDFAFTERNGATIKKKDLIGKPWVVSFFFTRCAGTCPMISSAMRKVHLQVKDLPVRLVSISVDPKFDTTDVLKQYAEIYTKDKDNWLFLTGDQDKTYKLIRDSFKLDVKEVVGPDRKPGWEVLHSNRILLVDAKGVVKGSYLALQPAEIERLMKELKAELKK